MVLTRAGITTVTSESELVGKPWNVANPTSGYDEKYFGANDICIAIDTSNGLICDEATKTFKVI